MKLVIIALVSCIAAAVMAVIVIEEIQHHRAALESMPVPKTSTRHDMDARLRSSSDWVAIKGTGSMAPYIPAHKDPTRIVAYVRVVRCDFDSLKKHMLVVFDTDRFGLILHQLSQKTAAGWVTSGLANHNYDTTRVYPENFRGKVVETYILEP
jgi:hypothetical protein